MAHLDPPELPQTRVSPALLMGAASPLWGYFGAVAAGGMAYWWMTRWTRPMNLEALFDAATSPALALVPPEPVVEAVVEAMAEPFQALEREAVGGEAAPLSPLAAEPVAFAPTAEAPPAAPVADSVALPDATPEPEAIVEPEARLATPEPAAEPPSAPRPKAKKAAAAPEPDPEG